jgi:hypothetical protein
MAQGEEIYFGGWWFPSSTPLLRAYRAAHLI